MIIKELYIAEFGGIKNKKITLDGGLTVIYGENESGKSTLLLFIKFMLYGLQRKSQSNIERERSLSWSGSVASGSMTVEHKGKSYRIERTFSDRSRIPEKLVIFSFETAMPVSTEKSPGEYFLGVPREVFESSACVGQMRSREINGEKTAQSLYNMLASADESVDTASALKDLNSIRTSYMHKNKMGGSIFEDENKIKSLELELDEAKNASLALEIKTESFNVAKKDYEDLRLDFEKKDALVSQFNKIGILKRFETLREKESELGFVVGRKEECAKKNLKSDFFPDRTHIAELKVASREISEREIALSVKEKESSALVAGFDKDDAFLGEIAEADGGRSEILAPVTVAAKKTKKAKSDLIVLGISAAVLLVFGIALSFIFGILIGCGFLIAAGAFFVATVAVFFVRTKRKKEENSLISSLTEQYKATPDTLSMRIDECLGALSLKREYDAKNAKLTAELSFAEELYESARERAYSLLLLTLGENAEPTCEELDAEAQRLSEFLDEYDNLAKEENTFLHMLEAERSALSRYDKEKLKSEITVPIEDATPEAVEEAERQKSFLISKRNALESKITLLQNELTMLRIKAKSPIALADRLAQLEDKVRKDRAFYDALVLAMDSIERASATMSGSVTPIIAKTASNFLGRISDDKYNVLRTSARLDISLDNGGFGMSVDQLSAGTRDIAYLSLRLALIMQIYSEERPPIIFDESLCQLDDKRLTRVIELLSTLSAEGIQIVLFTSHKREEQACKTLGVEYKSILL